MLEVTNIYPDGHEITVYVNPLHLVVVSNDGDRTELLLSNGMTMPVKEDVETVLRRLDPAGKLLP